MTEFGLLATHCNNCGQNMFKKDSYNKNGEYCSEKCYIAGEL